MVDPPPRNRSAIAVGRLPVPKIIAPRAARSARSGHRMVKFGISLQTDKVAKWADGYVNYDALKDTLSEMIHTGAALARVPVRTASPRIGGWR